MKMKIKKSGSEEPLLFCLKRHKQRRKEPTVNGRLFPYGRGKLEGEEAEDSAFVRKGRERRRFKGVDLSLLCDDMIT